MYALKKQCEGISTLVVDPSLLLKAHTGVPVSEYFRKDTLYL